MFVYSGLEGVYECMSDDVEISSFKVRMYYIRHERKHGTIESARLCT